jgi:hypothetical protein
LLESRIKCSNPTGTFKQEESMICRHCGLELLSQAEENDGKHHDPELCLAALKTRLNDSGKSVERLQGLAKTKAAAVSKLILALESALSSLEHAAEVNALTGESYTGTRTWIRETLKEVRQ